MIDTDHPAIAFVAAQSDLAQEALMRLRHRYGHTPPEHADVVVALGGDGFMLETLHRFIHMDKPIYGMNRGTVGFLMNVYLEDDLPNRITRAQKVTLHPLRMEAITQTGEHIEALAINEVSMLRETRQAAKIRISIDGKVRLARADLRWRPGMYGGRVNGLQPVSPRPDPAHGRKRHGPDPHLRVPPPALARGDIAAPHARHLRYPGKQQAPGIGGRRLYRGA